MDTSLDSQALPQGTRLQEFVIERVLGSGGFGITYLARDTSLGRQVVIKENLPVQFCFRDPNSLTVAPRHSQSEDAENFRWSLENFSKEATMLASLNHPGIVQVLRSFYACGTAYFIMPFVQGIAFDQLIAERQKKDKSFTEQELRGLTERMLDALGYLHERKIYHRDIKPANILISMEGVPVLIDFGSARQQISERSMTVIESAGYTPFEQLQSRGNVGPWSDLYALGGTLYKALTGDSPPKANDRAFDDPLVPLAVRQELVSRYSREFLMSIDKVMASRVPDRWQNSGEWLESLNIRSDKIQISSERPPIQSYQTESNVAVAKRPKNSRNMVLLALAACLVVLGLVYSNLRDASKRSAGKLDNMRIQSEKLKHAEAMAALGIHKPYSDITEDEKNLVYIYFEAVDNANADAMISLAYRYELGKGVVENEIEAVKWYRMALDSGNDRVAKDAEKRLKQLVK